MEDKNYTIIFLLCGLIIMSIMIKVLYDYNKTNQYCGTIVEIFEEENYSVMRRGRRKYRNSRYVLIKFDNNVIKAINLDPTSYYTSKIGQEVCLELSQSFMEGKRKEQ